MSSKRVYIRKELKEEVLTNSRFACSYCLLPEFVLPGKLQIDHVVAIQHDGATEVENLTACCVRCNLLKGTNLAGYLVEKREIHRLYHPVMDNWGHHFAMDRAGQFQSKTSVGEVTIRLLRLNQGNRCETRSVLINSSYKFDFN